MTIRLAAAYLTCLDFGGKPPVELPRNGNWERVARGSRQSRELYSFIAASIRGDSPQALSHCQAFFQGRTSTEQCSALFNAYRSYYTPFCSNIKSPFQDMDPLYLEHSCRTSLYPDARSCALLTNPAENEKCLELLNVIISLKSGKPDDCKGSEVCVAVLTHNSGGCQRIRGKLLDLCREDAARGRTR